jgi:hypothetical protein
MQTAAAIAAALIGLVIAFQIALVGGAPWGEAAWGGKHAGTLRTRLRAASLGAALVLVVLAWIVLAAAGVITPAPLPASWLEPATWVATGYFGLGALVNLISRSRLERFWAPVSLAAAICCGVVAFA